MSISFNGTELQNYLKRLRKARKKEAAGNSDKSAALRKLSSDHALLIQNRLDYLHDQTKPDYEQEGIQWDLQQIRNMVIKVLKDDNGYNVNRHMVTFSEASEKWKAAHPNTYQASIVLGQSLTDPKRVYVDVYVTSVRLGKSKPTLDIFIYKLE